MAELLAPAKLNLGLRVSRVDADGLHPIDSHMVTIDWHDRISVRSASVDELQLSGDPVVQADNIVWRALAAVRASGRAPDPVSIQLEKRIPQAAGLGGGSSDAAAVLRGFGLLEPSVAIAVGSDVAFFLTGGLARVTGVGERVAPVADLPEFVAAVVVPDLHLSTAAVYAAWDRLGGPDVDPIDSALGVDLGNDLLPAALEVQPGLAAWISALERVWDRPVHLSGSGSALFSFFDEPEAADAALTGVPDSARAARVVRPVGRFDPPG